MKADEITQAQRLIDKMNMGEKKCLKEIYDDEWKKVIDPKNFGKLFKDAVVNSILSNIKHLGIRSTGRCDEYERV